MTTRRVLTRLFWVVLILTGIGYGWILWWFGSHEVELIYHPDRVVRMIPDSLGLNPEKVVLKASDGVKLVGWIYRAPRPDSSALYVLYFHGNGGNASGRSRFHAQLLKLGVNSIAAEYRGYGESEGAPEEQGLYRDADAFYAYARDTLGIQPKRLVIYGSSLGAAVAVDLASRVDAAGLIVEGGFTSIVDRGQELYPYLPVRFMAKNRFLSIEKIPLITRPKLFIHAGDDEVVPIAHGMKLFDSAGPPKTFQIVHGGHNSAYDLDRQVFFGAIAKFFGTLRPGR